MAGRAFAHPETADAERELPTVSTPAPVRRKAAPLVVGSADDRAELEADRVAGEVISRLQGGESGETHVHDGCHGVARTAAPVSGAPEVGYAGGEISDDLSSRIESKRGSGSALPDDVRRRMESGFGRSLGHVRVHTDSESAKLNRSISARAFTTGNDIFFGAGEFNPGSAEGDKTLAHELAHTQQQSDGARRLHRKWDMKAKDLKLEKASDVSVFESRPILILTHPEDGDKIVVKGEDQPVGLGQLTATMHKKASKTSSVKQRALTKLEQGDVSFLLGRGNLNASWTARGRQVLAAKNDTTSDPEEAALMDVLTTLLDRKNKPVAMTFAEGEGADKLGDPSKYAGQGRGDDDKTEYRKLLMDPNHLRALGRITAIDAFMGNQDRVMNGNAGNWFVNLTSKSIQLIDSVDPGERTSRVSMQESFANGDWEKRTANLRVSAGQMFFDPNRADSIVDAIARAMGNAGASKDSSGFTQGGDMTVNRWINGNMTDGTSRFDFMKVHVEAGFKEGTKHILKIFAAPKWHDFKLNKKRKSIKKAASQAGAQDGVGADAYYRELARRAGLIQTQGV